MDQAMTLGRLELLVPLDDRPLGTRVFTALALLGRSAIAALDQRRAKRPMALVSRMRGTGRGVSLTRLLDALDHDHPLTLVSPFEGSDRVSGAVWRGDQLIGPEVTIAIAKLRWEAGALDLPMHVHDHSARMIIVRRGRGYFHITDERCETFTGGSVRSIPARERDVFLFSPGIVHTFSTESEPMELYSCQSPFIAFDDPDQYRLPERRWVAGEQREGYTPTVACDPGWTVLAVS